MGISASGCAAGRPVDPVVGGVLVAAVSTIGLALFQRLMASSDRQSTAAAAFHVERDAALRECREDLAAAERREDGWREKYFALLAQVSGGGGGG